MIKKNVSFFVAILLTVFAIVFIGVETVRAEENPIYGHISYVDGEALIIKHGEKSLQAMVNMPLVPGDIIQTNEKGRCEILFDNGTLIRMDKNSELQLDTVMSDSLTTLEKITTLRLLKGQIFSMSQVYKKEIFQVLTPTAALKMVTRSKNFIEVDEDGTTWLTVKRGKLGVLYGENQENNNKKYISPGKSYLVTTDHDFKQVALKKNLEFTAWNKQINKNFKDLHYGKSKVPPAIYRYSPGIVHFAERWSTKFGVWEYNELFGYVWRPENNLLHDRRPFWDANYVEVNGELVLVPNQRWGWAPAHLGTWYFSKTYGWTWIPGERFAPGICSVGLKSLDDPMVGTFNSSAPHLYSFSTLGSWIYQIFGGEQLYWTYLRHGNKAWRNAYYTTYQTHPATSKPPVKDAPENIRRIFKQIEKAPVEKIKNQIAFKGSAQTFELNAQKLIKTADLGNHKGTSTVIKKRDLQTGKRGTTIAKVGKISKTAPGPRGQIKSTAVMNKTGISKNKIAHTGLVRHGSNDWNPDSRWAQKVGVHILYSSKENAVVCPELNLSSREVNNMERNRLRRSVVDRSYLVYGREKFKGAGTYRAASGVLISSPSNNSGSSQPGKVQGYGAGSSSQSGSSSSTKPEKQ